MANECFRSNLKPFSRTFSLLKKEILVLMIVFSLVFFPIYFAHMTAWATTPTVPTHLSTYPLSNKSIVLHWNATSGAINYTIYRNYSTPIGFVKIVSGITGTNYTDKDPSLLEGVRYSYAVTATNVHNQESDRSEVASAIPYTPITSTNLEVAFAVSIPVVVVLVLIVYAILKWSKKRRLQEEIFRKASKKFQFEKTLAADAEDTAKSNAIEQNEKHSRTTKFWDIIRGDDWYPSLSLFQLFLWTVIIVFSFLFMSIIMFQHGIMPPVNSLNTPMILLLLGISVTSPIIGNAISSAKYASSNPYEPPENPPGFSTMLEEGKKPSITRFQMFVWTWISIIIFLISVVNTINANWNSITQLGVPDMNPVLVVLMGISQAAYLGGKGTSKTPNIGWIYPQVLKVDQISTNVGQLVSIFGNGFGDNVKKGIVWIGKEYFEYPGDGETDARRKILGWEDDRIDLKILKDFPGVGSYYVRVTAPGILVKYDQPLEIQGDEKT